MKTNKEELLDNQVKVTVTVDAADVDSRINKTYRDFAARYNFPGFRKGKAPRKVIDNALGAEAVAATVSEQLVNEGYPFAIEAEGLFPMGQPKFSADEIAKAGEPYEFSFEIEVKPSYELTSYDPVEIEMPASGATEAEIDDQLETMRGHYVEFVDASAAKKLKEDNFADLKIVATDETGKNVETVSSESRLYGPGSGMLSEAFDKEIMGMKKGETREFELLIPVTEDSVLLQPLAGQKVKFEVTCTVVKKKELPEVTDEWAKETMGFENVADMRERIAQSIEVQKDSYLPRLKENNCLQALMTRVEGEVPGALVEQQQTNLLQEFFGQLQGAGMTLDGYLKMQGITSDQFKADIKAQATDEVKSGLALDAWARHNGIEVTDAEVLAEFNKAGVPDPEGMMEEWRQEGRLYLIREGVIRGKAVNQVMETAVVTETDAPAKDETVEVSAEDEKAAEAE
ncbi:MAG: trigger factor [Eggerthellaceae bacterium]|nr:trigger factor [Eggerthellaceae bacterium]